MSHPIFDVQCDIVPGDWIILESDSPSGDWGVVFEDEGTTGYFYARDFSVSDELWVDALFIYEVPEDSADRLPKTAQILWTSDGMAALFSIDQEPRAVFHFGQRCGYASNPFPEPGPDGVWTHRADLKKALLWFSPGEGDEVGEVVSPEMAEEGITSGSDFEHCLAEGMEPGFSEVGWYHVTEVDRLFPALEKAGVRFYFEAPGTGLGQGDPITMSSGSYFGQSAQVLVIVHMEDHERFSEVQKEALVGGEKAPRSNWRDRLRGG